MRGNVKTCSSPQMGVSRLLEEVMYTAIEDTPEFARMDGERGFSVPSEKLNQLCESGQFEYKRDEIEVLTSALNPPTLGVELADVLEAGIGRKVWNFAPKCERGRM